MFLFIEVKSAIPMRLDRYIKNKYPKITQGIIEKNIRHSNIKVNNNKCTASTRVIAGNIIKLPKNFDINYAIKESNNLYFSEQIKQLASNLFDQYKIYEDSKILIINKPAGIASQQGSKIQSSIDQALQYINHNSTNEFKLVHRLDKDTSGIMVISKCRESAVLYSLLLKNRKIQKEYISFNWYDNIDKLNLSGEWFYYEDNEPKQGCTNLKLLNKLSNKVCKILWNPITGRKHQIRRHAYMMSMPIIGDTKYYNSSFKEYCNLLLHAKSIVLPGSVTNLDYPIKLDADLPHYFNINTINKYNG